MGNIALPGFFKCCKKKATEETNDNTSVKSTSENPEREFWSSKTDYLLSLVGYAVGLGNVWRFPYLAYKHGGGAFLIPYVIMLALAGLPLLFLECSLGQFASLGPIEIWRITPLFQGVGFTMVIISTLVSIYYNVIIAYSLFYLFASFRSYLPWGDCYEWADSSCQGTINGFCNVTLDNATMTMNMSSVHEQNLTCIADNTTELPSKQYWDKVALKRSSGMDETGIVVWHLALCLLLAWIITAAALVKGIKSSGKVVYFTAVFPYIVLIILLIRGVTLEGARDGIEYFIGQQSDISKLSNGEVWRDAATQIFYSLNTAWGGLIALSSYNKFQNNCYWDSIVVSVINCLTSILAGFAIFSILGHMALVSGKKVPEVVDEGFGLAFIAYPDALARLPVSPLWSILFFCMLLALGLDSQFALIETLTTTIQDVFPKVMKKLRIPLTTAICAVLFLLGLPCVTQAGIYWVNLIDSFCGGWALLFAAVLELVAVIWIYGGNRVILDIEMMLGKKHWIFWLWWRVCWYFVSPVLLAAILIWSLVTYEAAGYGGVVYPKWAIILGFLMVVFCLIWIPIIAIVKVIQAKGNIFQRIASCCRPTENWGPALVKNRGERYKDMKDDRVKEEDKGVEIPDIKGVDNVSFQRD
ncbi:sodium- and chloride-dependent neutral and basic amino acid transporter B(0+)-like isoform X1 [Rana temporaria]|uniref:sodium- and chloride-dependent neutral and basic amino acid transporter B(0+)-like isoform X1 n=1 Tax=Rana temporaria TaxID=8407 RepID=UPI001AADE897|nr:sodium- and chloride-dependent neutral and basic amino acid transporter B(0+)-like isoform X1 [Rana temporaria]